MICAPRSEMNPFIPVRFRNVGSRFRVSPIFVQPRLEKASVPSLRSRRILLLDDNPIFLRAIGRLLKTHSFDVHTEECHHRAFDKLSNDGNQFDFALVDVGLRGCSGWDFAKKLGQLNHAPPVILMSGEKHDKSDLASSHVKGFISKPFSIPDLIRNMTDLEVNSAFASC